MHESSALDLIHVDIEVMADSETIQSVGVELAFRQPRHIGPVDGEDHVIAPYLDA